MVETSTYIFGELKGRLGDNVNAMQAMKNLCSFGGMKTESQFTTYEMRQHNKFIGRSKHMSGASSGPWTNVNNLTLTKMVHAMNADSIIHYTHILLG